MYCFLTPNNAHLRLLSKDTYTQFHSNEGTRPYSRPKVDAPRLEFLRTAADIPAREEATALHKHLEDNAGKAKAQGKQTRQPLRKR